MIPNVVSWTHAPPRCMHVRFWNLVGLTTLQGLAASIETSNFMLAFFFFHGFFELTTFQVNEINTSRSPSIVEFCLLVCTFLFFILLSGFSHFCPDFGPQILRSGSRLNFCQSPPGPHIYPFGSFSFNRVKLVNPVQQSDKPLFASTFKSSSICFSCNTSKCVCVVLVTSMYFTGIGNVSSFGTKS